MWEPPRDSATQAAVVLSDASLEDSSERQCTQRVHYHPRSSWQRLPAKLLGFDAKGECLGD
jgi:hypothetical protein